MHLAKTTKYFNGSGTFHSDAKGLVGKQHLQRSRVVYISSARKPEHNEIPIRSQSNEICTRQSFFAKSSAYIRAHSQRAQGQYCRSAPEVKAATY